jgi:hypothetical protein
MFLIELSADALNLGLPLGSVEIHKSDYLAMIVAIGSRAALSTVGLLGGL